MQYLSKINFIHCYKVNRDTLIKVLQQNNMILSKLESIISGQKELKVRVDQIRETNNNNKNDDVSLNQEFIKVFVIKLYVFKLYG